MSRGTPCVKHHFTLCFSILTILQPIFAIPTYYSRRLKLSPEEFLFTYVPSEEDWSGIDGIYGQPVQYSSFRRSTRNNGAADEARYQIRHVGDLPMFRFG